MSNKTAWIGDNASQQIQEQSAKYGGGAEISGYAALTRPTTIFKNWLESEIGEIAEIIGGGTPKSSDPDNFAEPGTGIAWLTPADLSGYNNQYISLGARDLSKKGYQSSSAKIMPKGSLLFSSRAPIGYVAIADNEISTNQGFKSFVFSTEIDPKFAFFYLKSIKGLAESRGTGTTFKELSGANAKKLPFIIAPVAEQQQIAAKLAELLAQVDSIKTRLDAIPKILKRFRQSVLAAATSGELTKDWRNTERIVDSWRNVRLSEIAEIQGGITKDSKKQSLLDEEVPYLRVANVQRGFLDLSEIKTIRIPKSKLAAMLLQSGDILFNEGGDIDKLGRGWIWEGQIERCSFQNHVFRARLYDQHNEPKYISWWGNYRGLEYFLRSGKQTTNLASINKTMLSNLPISLPSPEEQTEIVNRVEQLFAYADQIEQRVKDAQARVNHLTQAILAKAFRGELTADWRAQNPDLISGENSAEALLKRIKAERESGKSSKKSKASL